MEPLASVDAVPAPGWSLALGQFGQATIVVAVVLQLLSTVLYGLAKSKPNLEPWARRAFFLGCAGFFVAFGTVVALFVQDQFQYKYVFDHGARDNELQYKIAGTWSGQEGSFLLWGTMSALFAVVVAPFTRQYRRWYTMAVAPFLACLGLILAYESPFALRPLVDGQAVIPATGNGLSPSLLNYWVVIHPPTIFAGFGSLTVLFALAVAALATNNLVDWVPIVRPWALLSLAILGLGLTMGGFWAYETLGWGGFWMWDPVENTSFVPWVALAGFVHGAMVQVSRQKWHMTNVMLAGLPFLLFCYGTFLTRSGFLGDTSVHSFAEMNRSALYILIAVIVLGFASFLALWLYRAFGSKPDLPNPRPMDVQPINRETTLGSGIWLLVAIGVTTAIGMSIPVLQSLFGSKPRVVEEPFYNTVLSFFFLPLLVLMAFGPFITWRGLGLRKLLGRFVNVFSISIGLVGCTLLWVRSDVMGIQANWSETTNLLTKYPVHKVGWVMVLAWFCLFGMVATTWKLYENMRRSRSGVGGMLAHFGVGVMMLGLIVSRGLEQRSKNPNNPADPTFVITPIAAVTQLGFSFRALDATKTFIDRTNKVNVEVQEQPRSKEHSIGVGRLRIEPLQSPGKPFVVQPGLYFNGISKEGKPIPMIWPAIHGRGTYDLYLVIHDLLFDASGETDMKVGEQRLLREENILVTYNGLRTEGTLGTKGAKFFAKVNVKTPQGEWNVEPMITMGEHGMEQVAARVNDKYKISLSRINAADKSATIQIKYVQPAYIAELYYKPLTLLVWMGVGIMTLGGAMSAWARRGSPKSSAPDSEPPADTESQEDRNAPEAPPQV